MASPSFGLMLFLVVYTLCVVTVAAGAVSSVLHKTLHSIPSERIYQRTFLAFGVLMSYDLVIAQLGLLNEFDHVPIPIAKFILAPMLALTVYVACCTQIGHALATRLSARELIGFQIFRLGPEVFLHAGYLEGALPAQMTFPPHGRNVDLFIALTALALVLAWPHLASCGLRPIAVAWAFGIVGVGALINILVTAMISLTHPLRDRFMPHFEPGLEYIVQVPFVLLPGVLFPLAFFTHLLLFRQLLTSPSSAAADGDAPSMW